MKTTVVYHSADFDGIFCREIARKFIPDATFIGWDFGNDPLEISEMADGEIYILDLPVDRVFGFEFRNHVWPYLTFGEDKSRFIWIDHHKSAIDSHPAGIPGYGIDGVAACRLAWQWFTRKRPSPLYHLIDAESAGHLPEKEMFIDRLVSEPWAVRLAGEYDIWDKRDPDAELFQHGLRSCDLTNYWPSLLDDSQTGSEMADSTVRELLNSGRALQYARTKENASIIKEIGFTIRWEGLTFLACNAARYNSHLFTAGLTPEHDACFGFKWTGRDWSVSLYHAPGREQHDLSQIAVRHGGGGHRGACGFRTDKLPFLPAP